MKKFAAAVVLIILGAGLYFVFKFNHPAPENPGGGSSTDAVSESNPSAPARPENPPAAPAVLTGVAGVIPTNGPATQAAPPQPANIAASPQPAAFALSSLPPLTVLDNARVAMKNYGTTFGENPIGTNPEITEALTGKNPKGINFIAEDSGLRVNEQGEMVDAYGTPFFFHQLSGKQMEIRSAGQDKKMWTFDDLVIR